MIPAGFSDKYGHVFVERVGRTGFDDTEEPVALLRAQDEHAVAVLEYYMLRLKADRRVTQAQVESVQRQLRNFLGWRIEHPGRVRVPGS